MIGEPSRRRFLKTLGAGGALIVLPPALGQTACTIQGSERGVLRLVFYTDVHARTEWETPNALMMGSRSRGSRRARR